MIYTNMLLLLVRHFNWGFENIINEILYIIPTIFAYEDLASINDLLKCAGLYDHDNYRTILLLNIKKKEFHSFIENSHFLFLLAPLPCAVFVPFHTYT